MNKTDERRLREHNATLTVQVQDSRKRIAELEERLQGIEYAADAADQAAERIRELRLRVAELEEENSRLRAKLQNPQPSKKPQNRRVVKKIRKALTRRV